MSWKNQIPKCFGESNIFAENQREFQNALICIQEALECGVSISKLKSEFLNYLETQQVSLDHITNQIKTIETYINIAEFYTNV